METSIDQCIDEIEVEVKGVIILDFFRWWIGSYTVGFNLKTLITFLYCELVKFETLRSILSLKLKLCPVGWTEPLIEFQPFICLTE